MDPRKLELAALIRQHNRQAGTQKTDLVRRMGYRNLNRGRRRVDAWLAGEDFPRGDQVERLARALGVEPPAILDAIAQDRETLLADAAARRARDPSYYLVIRYFAGCYGQQVLGRDLDDAAALRLARQELCARQRRGCLNTPGNLSYWLDAEGRIEHVTRGGGPRMYVNGRACLLKVG